MLVLFVKIVLLGSIAGMAAMIALKAPVLRALPVKEKPAKIELKTFLPRVFEKTKQAGLSSKKFLRKNFSGLKHIAKNSLKQKPVKLSADYWEKVRKGK